MSLQLVRRLIGPLAFAGAVAVPAAVLVSYGLSYFLESPEGELTDGAPRAGRSSPYASPGIRTPLVVAAADADLPDDEPIIGIEVNGRFRAYRTAALAGMTSHVVNDLIDEIPVTVTYCDLANCARAFTGEQRGTPLELSTGGMVDGNLALKLGDVWICQPTGETMFDDGAKKRPLANFPIMRTTWKTWRNLHPKTEVYLGANGRPVQSKGVGAPPMAPRAGSKPER